MGRRLPWEVGLKRCAQSKRGACLTVGLTKHASGAERGEKFG